MPISRRTASLILLLFLVYLGVGFGLRHLAEMPGEWLDPDSIAEVAGTVCLHSEFGVAPGQPNFRHAPLYPAALGVACKGLGVDVKTVSLVVNGLCHLLLLFVIASHPICASARGFTAAIIAVGLDPLLLTYSARTYREPMVILAVALVVLTLDRLMAKPRGGGMVGLGAAWGASLLVKPILMYLGVFLLPVLPFLKRSARWLLLGAMPIGLLLIVPWSVRNYRLSGEVMPVAGGAWTTIMYGDSFAHNIRSGADIEELQRLATEELAELDKELGIEGLTLHERDPFYREHYLELVTDDPWRLARKLAVQSVNFWILGGSFWKSVGFAVAQLPLLGLAAYVVWRRFRSRPELYIGFLAVAVYLICVHSMSLAVARYSMPLRPWLIVICVTFLWGHWEEARRSRLQP